MRSDQLHQKNKQKENSTQSDQLHQKDKQKENSTQSDQLHQKDKEWVKVSKNFRQKKYDVFLPHGLEYYQKLIKQQEFKVTAKDKATVLYAITASAFDILKQPQSDTQDILQTFFKYLDKYVTVCLIAAQTGEIKGMFTDRPRQLLKNCLELLCQFKSDHIKPEAEKWVNAFIAIKAPGYGYDLALPALREQLFHERTEFERKNNVRNAQKLAQVYLALSEPVEEQFRFGRAQVMNLLSDLAYFQGGDEGEQEALKWAEKCLEICPQDKFAQAQKNFIEQRMSVIQQIRRFKHDTNNTIAGITSTLDLAMRHPAAYKHEMAKYLQTIKAEVKRLHGINRFIENKQAVFEYINPVKLINESVISFTGQADINIAPRHCEQKWETDPDYFSLILHNLVKNACEAFHRKNTPRPERKIEINADLQKQVMTVQDNAGGIDPQHRGRIFTPYVSSKGIKKETGLGLSQVKIAAEKIDGKVIFPDHQPQGGARFEVYLSL